MWCSICTTESPRVGERYTASLFGTLLSGGTSASCSGVSFAGFPLFSSAPSAALALCTGSWYTGTSFLGRGSGSIGAGLSPAPAVLSLAYGTLDTRQRGDLLAVRGHPKRQAKDVHQVIISHVEEHSKKPDEVSERIERLMGDVPRIELFTRQKADGWDVWGNEVINDVELTTQHISP